MSEPVTVTQLNTRVKDLLSSDPGLRDIWVTAEVSNLKKYSSGHYYFTLKDAGSEIRSVLFANSRLRMDFEPTDNMKVLAFGHVDMYVPRGSYQFIVETMRRSGIGDLYAQYEKLKAKLKAEGLFDQSRKRPLPRYPRIIGVVTSPTGAVIHDIITTSASRFPADILLAPAQVQGEGAAESIVRGIELLNREGVDVIIVGRGGGSIEDLWAFNEEPVARAIAASEVPVVSAVGHETDFTIADFVADVRAPTPTGAAAIILRDKAEVQKQISDDIARLNRAMSGVVREMRARFDLLDAKLSPKRAEEGVNMMRIQLEDLSNRADAALKNTLTAMRHRFEVLDTRLSPASALDDISALVERVAVACERAASMATRSLEASQARMDAVGDRHTRAISNRLSRSTDSLDSLSKRMEGLNPRNVLGRGYGMVTTSEGRVVTSISSLSAGMEITVNMRDGRADAVVRETEVSK